MLDTFYLFGLQRSGTNYLEQLIRNNFRSSMANRASKTWKHNVAVHSKSLFKPNVPVFVIHKNPYLWIESICTRNRIDWERTQKKYTSKTGDALLGGLAVAPLAQAWVDFHTNWCLTANDYLDPIVVRYEDILNTSLREQLLCQIARTTGLQRLSDTWTNPGLGAVAQSKKYDQTSQQYYISQQPTKLSDQHLAAINQILQPELLESFGYHPVLINTPNGGESTDAKETS